MVRSGMVTQVGLGWASFGAASCGEAGFGYAGKAALGAVRSGNAGM